MTDPVTDCSINYKVVKTNMPAAMAPAIGNPTSPTIVKNSIIVVFNISAYQILGPSTVFLVKNQ